MLENEDCLFCRIAAGEIPSDIVAEDADWLAFHDVSPRAPVHVLIIPRRHVGSMADLDPSLKGLAGELLVAAAEVARKLGVAEDGYRLVTNSGARAGQSVFHWHLHLLAGRAMGWPPG